ncbi:MAG: efflux RND transporter permease subunit, partial [Blastocatellia bacterium]
AIVVVENIYTHLARGKPRAQAVRDAMQEIAIPIIGSTVTPVVVFLPLALLTGVVGVFFRSLALTMAVALLTSLALALSFTPVLAERFVRVKRKDMETGPESGPHDEKHGQFLSAIIARYEIVLGKALDHKVVVLILAGVVLVGSYVVYRSLGSDFLPEFDEGAFVLDYIAPPGTSLAETDRMLQHVGKLIKDTPEIQSFSRRTGMELGLSVTEPNTGDFLAMLKDKRGKATDDVTDDLRKQIESSEPALKVEFAGIIGDLIGDLTSSPEPIEVKLYSEDEKALKQATAQVMKVIKVPGVVDSLNKLTISGPAVTFKIDPQRAAQLGVNATDIDEAVTTAMLGTPASAILDRDRLITVRVTMPDSVRVDLDQLRQLPIRSSSGALFRLGQV